MKAQLCHSQDNLKTFSLYLLGSYAEVWCWLGSREIIVLDSLGKKRYW